jgi:pimeloyl-ACP methyl ester carboxylesterase
MIFVHLLILSLLACCAVSFVINEAQPSRSSRRATVSDVNLADTSKPIKGTKDNRVAVLLCPAQFCVPADYESLLDSLKKQDRGDDSRTIGTCRVAPLPRTEWIKVARNLPTRAFLEAKLPVHSTLSWYFDAMETALSDIFAREGPDVNISIIGHSIGGWVARAYLGGLSGSSSAVYWLTQRQCSSFVTLGTPHASPDTALVDQTRGLLGEVENAIECSPQSLAERGIDVTCVGSSGLDGKLLSTNVEELVAASSYLPLLGRLGSDVKGDGIVPLDLAFMPHPARKIQVDLCGITGVPVRHAHVVPTPWNLLDGSSPSIALPEDFAWYGSAGVISQWAKYVR